MSQLFTLVLAGLFYTSSFLAQGWQWRNPEAQTKILKDQNNDLYIFANTPAGISIKKRDLSGNVLWVKTITGGATASSHKIDAANNLILLGNLTSTATIDNNTLAANGSSNFFILKISPTSTVLSANVYGGTSEVRANDIFINANGEYLIGGGYKGSFNINGTLIAGDTLSNFFIIKTDASQNVLWWETNGYVPGAEGSTWIDELVETSSGNVCAVYSTFGLVDYKGQQNGYDGQFMVELDTARNLLWETYLCYPWMGYSSYSDLQVMGDTVYMASNAHYNHSGPDAWINRWTPSGTKTTRYMGNLEYFGYNAFGNKVYFAAVCAGSSYYYRYIGSLNSNLSNSFSDSTTLAMSNMYVNYYAEMECVDSSRYYIGGSDSALGNFVGLFELNSSALAIDKKARIENVIFPNPSTGILNVTGPQPITFVKVYDANGCEVECSLSGSEINLCNQPKGIYVVEVLIENRKLTKRVVLE
jgi:hypothetical protein